MAGGERIFISYRRQDAGGHAGRLYDRLRHWFDDDALFYDLDSIDAGDTFPARIEAGIDDAAVALVLIGPDWLDEINRRVDQPGVDFVRREVELALCRHVKGMPVFPVLLGGAAMPAAHELHADLQATLSPLCALDAHTFDGKQADWDAQFVRLRERVAEVPGVPAPRFRAPAGAQQPFRVIERDLTHFRDPNGLLPRLREQLAASGSAAVLARAALYGMGGVGKTQLALKYSHEYRDTYAGVWCLRAENETTLQLDAKDCCDVVGAPINDGELPALALKRWLERQPSTWLLVFDNAESVEALRPYLPQAGHHHLLITSRNPAWGGVAKPLELETWTPQQGADFLAARLPGAAGDELLQLADRLGGLPLALEQAASYIETTGISLTDYRALLDGANTEGLILDEGRAATGYERSVAATLSLAFDKLSPAAAQLLRLLAFAAPEPFPERFFKEASEHLPAELAAAAANPLIWNRTVGELRSYGLAARDDMPAIDRAPGEATDRCEPALSLHRLTQQVVRARLASQADDLSALVTLLRARCPVETNLPSNWPRFAILGSHVTQLARHRDSGGVDRRALSWLFDRIASYLRDGPALFADAVVWFRLAIEINAADLGEEHLDTVANMKNLAETFQSQGDLASARALQEKVLGIWSSVFGQEHPVTLASMGSLATILVEQGDFAGARILQEHVLAVSVRVLGAEHPATLASMGDLAQTLAHQGDLVVARALEKTVLEVSRRVLGEEHPATLASMNNLAGTLRSQGDLSGARVLEENVLEVCRHVLGEEHPHTLTAMANLAYTLSKQGDPTAARVIHERVFEIRRRVLGEEHPHTLASMAHVAHALWQLDERLAALRMRRAAADGFARALGPDHPDAVATREAVERMQAEIDQHNSQSEGTAS